MTRFNCADVRFFCELTLLETTASSAAKEAFWHVVKATKNDADRAALYINPRFFLGDRIATISAPSTAIAPITSTIFVDHKAATIVVAFPGTNHKKQKSLFSTLRSVYLPWRSVDSEQAHRGFYTIYSLIGDSLVSEVEKLLCVYSEYTIVVAGYSLGGALGRIFVWHLCSSFFRKLIGRVHVMTWGAPRVFTTAAASRYTDQLLSSSLRVSDVRYEMPGDRIVDLPPAWSGYKHVGARIVAALPNIVELNTWFERFFIGVHQSYIANMRFVLLNLVSRFDAPLD